jgi:hypothetical protein
MGAVMAAVLAGAVMGHSNPAPAGSSKNTVPLCRGVTSVFGNGFVLILLVLLMATSPMQAQQSTLDAFLSAALRDPAYIAYDDQEAVFSKPSSYGLPWVPNLEFRTRINELLDSRQQYALRADVGNPWQIQSNHRYFKGIRTAKNLEQQLLLKKLMRERYELALDYWFAAERVSIMEKLKVLRQQISAAMVRRSGSAEFDAEQFLNSELEMISRTADVQEAEFERALARARITELHGGSDMGIDLSGLIDVEGVRNVLSKQDTGGPVVEMELLKQEIANSELRMKTDRLNFDLGFVQGMYAPYRADRGDGLFGLSAGVTIPLFNQNRDDIARERLKVIERKGVLEQFRQREAGRRRAEIQLALTQIAQYTRTDSLVQDVRKRQMNLAAVLSKDYNPIVELKYQEKLLQLDALKLRIKREIFRQYIACLDNDGRLHQRPLVNYLGKGLEPMEQ